MLKPPGMDRDILAAPCRRALSSEQRAANRTRLSFPSLLNLAFLRNSGGEAKKRGRDGTDGGSQRGGNGDDRQTVRQRVGMACSCVAGGTFHSPRCQRLRPQSPLSHRQSHRGRPLKGLAPFPLSWRGDGRHNQQDARVSSAGPSSSITPARLLLVPALARMVPACQRARVPDLCRGRWGWKRREAPPSSFAEINPSFDQFHCPGPGWPTQGSCCKGGHRDPPWALAWEGKQALASTHGWPGR
jgi:hypothetical protein